jgi:DNA polymerase-2
MNELTGWLLDLYEDAQGGIAFWLLGEDGQRRCLRQAFPVTFYAAGHPSHLNNLRSYLENQPVPVRLAHEERRDLSCSAPVPVLSIEVARAADQPDLFRKVSRRFPDLTYYDADLTLALRHAALFGTFPLARCRVKIDNNFQIHHLAVLDSPWDLDPLPPPLRILTIEPDTDPSHTAPRRLDIRSPLGSCSLTLEPGRSLLLNLRSLLLHHDPDLLITAWGDTWLLPYLLEQSQRHNLPIPLNRAPTQEIIRRPERSYFSYGQIVFRGQQVHLFGRWHIDRCNAMLWGDYALDGILEAARVTTLPVQVAARSSPGTGISSMQIVTALRHGILVPWHKQQAERLKTAFDLIHTDQGGMVYQPLTGLHRDVGEIDFVSMYPSIMVRHNISPETMRAGSLVPSNEAPGLIPLTLEPLLHKRIALKARLAELPPWHPDYARNKARSSAHKWLLVTCFGYLGYKNARFGRIEAHEAVTTWGREALLRAKEVAENLGFTVLHMYVDGLWVKKPGASHPPDFQELLGRIADRTGLSISLDGIYRWVAFLPSRQDARIPVPNRYFGVFQDGSLKVRGLEARRRDTPPFIAETQMELLHYLAQARDADQLPALLPGAVNLLRQRLAELRSGRVALEKLLVAQKLSRKLEAYTSPSPGAQAVEQLVAAGKSLQPGERARFLYMRGKAGIHAWDLMSPPVPAAVDLARYRKLLMRAAVVVFEPFGVDAIRLNAWVLKSPVPVDWIESLHGSFEKPRLDWPRQTNPTISVAKVAT